jgi:hypothetical protein
LLPIQTQQNQNKPATQCYQSATTPQLQPENLVKPKLNQRPHIRSKTTNPQQPPQKAINQTTQIFKNQWKLMSAISKLIVECHFSENSCALSWHLGRMVLSWTSWSRLESSPERVAKSASERERLESVRDKGVKSVRLWERNFLK